MSESIKKNKLKIYILYIYQKICPANWSKSQEGRERERERDLSIFMMVSTIMINGCKWVVWVGGPINILNHSRDVTSRWGTDCNLRRCAQRMADPRRITGSLKGQGILKKDVKKKNTSLVSKINTSNLIYWFYCIYIGKLPKSTKINQPTSFRNTSSALALRGPEVMLGRLLFVPDKLHQKPNKKILSKSGDESPQWTWNGNAIPCIALGKGRWLALPCIGLSWPLTTATFWVYFHQSVKLLWKTVPTQKCCQGHVFLLLRWPIFWPNLRLRTQADSHKKHTNQSSRTSTSQRPSGPYGIMMSKCLE